MIRAHRSPSTLALLLVALALGCSRAEPGLDAPVSIQSSNKPFPSASAQIEELRRTGVEWTNPEIRGFYVRQVAAIGPANERWKKEKVPAEERARRAYAMRHEARLLSRAMMKDAADVEVLRMRDQAKYGHPDGPAFYELVEKQRNRGLSGDALYEAIVESAQQTDARLNDLMGPR